MSKEQNETTQAVDKPREQALIAPRSAPSVIARLADRYGVDQAKMLECLKATAFKGGCTNEQLMALCIVADQYKLNPWTREIYAFPDKQNGIVPVVGVDGWARIINDHPMFDGLDFDDVDGGVRCRIFRKDRQHAVSITEFESECKRNTSPWQSHPRRMLRHKALIQCARIAFGFSGIYDEDEAERIVEATGKASPAPYNKPSHKSPLDSVTVDAPVEPSQTDAAQDGADVVAAM